MVDMFTLSQDHIDFIVEVSRRLGSNPKWNTKWKLSIKKYLDGHQFNWHSEKGSLMWRSVNWNADRLEFYTGSDITTFVYVEDI
jgi:hypothetical protein